MINDRPASTNDQYELAAEDGQTGEEETLESENKKTWQAAEFTMAYYENFVCTLPFNENTVGVVPFPEDQF